MPETPIQAPPGFAKLLKLEQVRYVQALWNQITEQEDQIPVPESHLKLAEARLRRYREHPSSQPAFEVLDRLSKERAHNSGVARTRVVVAVQNRRKKRATV